MFFGILKPYIIDIYGFYFEEYMPGYLYIHGMLKNICVSTYYRRPTFFSEKTYPPFLFKVKKKNAE